MMETWAKKPKRPDQPRLSERLARTVQSASHAGWQCRVCGAALDKPERGCWAHDVRAVLPELQALEAREERLTAALGWVPLASDSNDWWEEEGMKALTSSEWNGFNVGFRYGVIALREVIRAALAEPQEAQ